MSATVATVSDLPYVLLWSHEHRAWWRANGLGYTKKVAEAGLYDPATVEARWRRGNSSIVVVRLGAVAPRRPVR